MNADLTTRYLGLKLANPIVVAACPLTGELDVLKQLADSGAAAAVLPSLFEEQLDANTCHAEGLPAIEPTEYFRAMRQYNRGPEAYLAHLSAAKRAVSIPLIGSLNLTRPSKATCYARRIQETGADALELNIFFLATDPEMTSQELEARSVELVAAVRREITIPLAVKISPFYTALPNFARRLVDAGADGLVLFNRFLQPDIDLDAMRAVPRLTLSTPDEIRLSLRWIAILHGRVRASLAATSGVHFADDVVKLVLAGADAVMVASTLYRRGVETLPTLIAGVQTWLEANDYASLDQVRGVLSQRKCPDPAVFQRANYFRALNTFADQA